MYSLLEQLVLHAAHVIFFVALGADAVYFPIAHD